MKALRETGKGATAQDKPSTDRIEKRIVEEFSASFRVKLEGEFVEGSGVRPLARRAEAFRMNDDGWAGEIKNLARYVS